MTTRISEVRTELLRMPLPRPMMSGSSSGKKGGPVSHINMPVLFITTEDGVRGLGYAWSLLGGATATRCVLKDDFAPLLVGERSTTNACGTSCTGCGRWAASGWCPRRFRPSVGAI
jgi:hypothetical protein